jgi:hypothetical protein
MSTCERAFLWLQTAELVLFPFWPRFYKSRKVNEVKVCGNIIAISVNSNHHSIESLMKRAHRDIFKSV